MRSSVRPPRLGEKVGDYLIVKQLGDGASGIVYKAECAGSFYALKFLKGRLLERLCKSETSILLRLRHPNVVRILGYGYWPEPGSGHPYIVMEFAGGRTLEVYAEEENPSARKSASIVLDTGLTLGEVHRQGVYHRDLKPENIIIRDANERPMLVDFGVGSLSGAPPVTGEGKVPGTFEFRSPESWRFVQKNSGKNVRYRYGPADELWSLGVTFYWLLTDLLPFGERFVGNLEERIISHAPKAPHLVNARVPVALSDICMKMLEKRRKDRYASVAEFCAALKAAMDGAEADGSWDLPLMDSSAPERLRTEHEPSMADGGTPSWLRAWRKESRPRGQKPAEKIAPPVPVAPVAESPVPPVAPPASIEEVPAVPAAEVLGEGSPQALAPCVEAEVMRPVPPTPAPSRGARGFPSGVGLFPVGPMVLHLLKVPALAAGLLVVSLGGALVVKRSQVAESASAAIAPSSPSAFNPTLQAGFVPEVEIPWKPLDSTAGAEPSEAQPPAPMRIAMVRKDDENLKIEETPVPQKRQGLRSLVKKCVGAACCATLAGCPAPQVRPTPPPEACPPGAVETMKRLGIEIDAQHGATFPVERTGIVTVQEGFTSIRLIGPWKKLPDNTMIRGRLIIGEDRVYGRFTEAETPGRETFPVCFELRDRTDRGRGVVREADGGPERARVFSTVTVRAVDRFE